MKSWRKGGSGCKSNILILITVVLLRKVTQSADALGHLISFMSWRIWISQDTRVKQKVISASFAYLNLVESKLNCQNRDYLPLGILLRVLMTIVWYHGEFTDRIFYWSPTCTKTSEFEQSVKVRTDAKSESGIGELRFPHCEHFSRSRPLHCARKRRSGTNFPKIVKYKSPSRSKLKNLTG